MPLRPLGQHVGAAIFAGLVAGMLVAGVLGRIAMRVAGFLSRPELIGIETANGNRVGEITLGGTIAIALFSGLAAGVLGGALYASAEPWLRRVRPWHGLLFGFALLGGMGFTVIEPANFDFQRFGSAGLNVLMFAALFVVFGVLVAWLFERIRSTIGRGGAVPVIVEIAAWLAAALAALALAAGAAASLAEVTSLEPGRILSPRDVDGLVTAALFGTALVIPAIVRWRGLPPVIGYVAFALPLIAGTLRTLDGLRQMLG